ncbi:MAG: methylenetetrahydrofolate--tRNA-(uracil(54)-C(5))-methyltransferase (FADH(2)-oxidizing) TrmFO [Oscillospiraceae bacterium]|nr:methylenetetrahydrofolate--tRNA-(uracil(54)-C(5))-methyltransferase (FADH(2)-oxidizing) TrmFO [Oscillospiraceae bacterium]
MRNAYIIGAGLAGCEAAWQLAEAGINVTLYEMKPEKFSPAHKSGGFAELVCSNSLRAAAVENAVGLLKEEMRRLNSLIIQAADATRVQAGGALAVDREKFSAYITEKIKNHKNITVVTGEITSIPDVRPLIIATGPLTEEPLSSSIRALLGNEEYLGFFDAAAPIVTFESVDMESAYFKSRYDKGEADYINCPMTEDEYRAFWEALTSAECAEIHGFEDDNVFEGCMPVEVMAKRGFETLRYGPLKPVGLRDPKTGITPYAVVQLRRDNREGTLYNLVGFQTHLKFGEQKRVFSMIPALRNAEFVRYGVMHRNTYIKSPKLLSRDYSLRTDSDICFAGQMTGVEGYVESAASGLLAGLTLACRLLGREAIAFPQETALGALSIYVSSGSVGDFQPMNITFGIIPPLAERVRVKKEKNALLAKRSLDIIDRIVEKLQGEDKK